MKKIILETLLLLVTISIGVGCTKKKHPDDIMALEVGQHEMIRSLDPAVAYDSASWEIVSSIYETLYQYSYLEKPYRLEPLLAADLPTVSKDGKTITIRLRDSVRYQDDRSFVDHRGKGRELQPSDFIHAFKRLADPRLQAPSWYLLEGKIAGLDSFRKKLKASSPKERPSVYSSEIEGLKVSEDHKLVIQLTRPNPQFIYLLAMPFTAPVPPEAIDQYADKNGTIHFNAVGTGPFTLADWQQGKKIVLERNTNYHPDFFPTQGAEDYRTFLADSGKVLPILDRVNIEIQENPEKLIKAFQDGKYHFIQDIDHQGITQPRFRRFSTTGMTFDYLFLNMTKSLFKRNQQIRQAIASAVSREGYLQLFTSPGYSRQTSLLSPGVPGRPENLVVVYDSDPKKSKHHLQLAGYDQGNGLPPLLMQLPGRDEINRKKADFLISEFSKIGIKVRVQLNDFPEYLDRIRKGDFDLAVGSWKLDYPDAENGFQLLYGPNRAPGPNLSGYDHPEFNRLFEKMIQLPNSPTRFELIAKLDQHIQEEVPWVLLGYRNEQSLSLPTLKNYRVSDLILNKFKYLRVEK